MRKCATCNQWIKEEDAFCWNCGKAIEPLSMQSMSSEKPNSVNPYEIVTLLFLILAFPVGLLMMWVFQPFTKRTRWIISIILVGTSLLGMLLIILWTSMPGYMY